MKKGRKALCGLLALLMVLTVLLAGCQSSPTAAPSPTSSAAGEPSATPEASAAPSAPAGVDTSKSVQLVGYLLGSAPQGMPDVVDALNAKLQTDINATTTINYLDWSNASTQYPLILAPGQTVDWVYSANWFSYADQAAKGAFAEITQQDIQTYMPNLSKLLPAQAWDQAKVNGKIYMIPGPSPDPSIQCIIYRGDLAKKYGITTPITTPEQLTAYFDAIKTNEPSMIPADLSASGTDLWTGLYMWLTFGQDGLIYPSTTYGYATMADGSVPFGTYQTIFDDPYATIYKNAFTQLKSWYDAGYINKDVLTNQNSSQTLFDQGKSGIGFANTTSVQSSLTNAIANGWDPQIILCTDKNGHYMGPSYIGNGVSIAAVSKNPERTMMAMDKIFADKDYATLAYYGIEGTDYVLNSDGQADYPSGVTAANSPYAVDASGFWFVDKNLLPQRAGLPQSYLDLVNTFDTVLYNYPAAAYSFDNTSVKTQYANMTNVLTQYYYPLMFGAVDNVDTAWNTLQQQMNAAGLQDLMTADQQQLTAYLQANPSSGS